MADHEARTHKSIDELTSGERAWYGWLMQDRSVMPDGLRRFLNTQEAILKRIPSEPRCDSCQAPFGGIGGRILGPLGYRRSELSPRLCNGCSSIIRKEQSGVEIPLAMLFADVRGSTAMAETMSPTQFQQIINRFYKETSEVLITHRSLVERLIGDQVNAYFVPGITGADYPLQAVEAAKDLLDVTGHNHPDGPWIEVGVGVHVGIAYVGSVGSHDRVSGITALGDDVNTSARLASHAATGEIVLSDTICEAAGIDTTSLEVRTLDLKGKSAPFSVFVILPSTF